jgi:hypothetical protein
MDTRLKFALWWLAPVALISFAAQMAWGQVQDAKDERAPNPSEYHFPTNRQRLHTYLSATLGPGALLQTTIAAGAIQFSAEPPEWSQGAGGYGRRFASQWGRLAVQNSVKMGLGMGLRQDLEYRRCGCTGFRRRTAHALISNFTAVRSDGSSTFTIAKVASHYAGAMISTVWYPDRYTATGDGIRIGTWSLASDAGLNFIREFWPEIRRLFHR